MGLGQLDWRRPNIATASNFLTKEECRAFIALGETAAFEAAPIYSTKGPQMRTDIRDNGRVIIDDPSAADQLWDKLSPLIEAPLRGRWMPLGLNERIRLYRYEPGQQFDWHVDGTYVPDEGSESVLTFMVYLNDGFTGGETIFGTQDGPEYHETMVIEPEEGTALLFFHRVLHRGAPVKKGLKYVLRTDVMFRRV